MTPSYAPMWLLCMLLYVGLADGAESPSPAAGDTALNPSRPDPCIPVKRDDKKQPTKPTPANKPAEPKAR